MENILENMEGQMVTIDCGICTIQMKVRMINIDEDEIEFVDGDDASFVFPRKSSLIYQDGVYYLNPEQDVVVA